MYEKLLLWKYGDAYVGVSSVTQSCLTLCDPVNRSTPGLPVHHQLLEFTQTHVHRVGDAIQPSHPLSSPFPPAPNSSQHQSLFQWVNSSHYLIFGLKSFKKNVSGQKEVSEIEQVIFAEVTKIMCSFEYLNQHSYFKKGIGGLAAGLWCLLHPSLIPANSCS